MKLISLKNRLSAGNRRCNSANGFSLLPLALQPRLFLIVIILVVSGVALLINLMLFSSSTYAVSTLNLTISANSLSLDITPVSVSGNFASSNNLTISAATNNYTGYTLKIAAETANDRALSDSNGNSFDSISASTTGEVFSGSDINYNNKWGYLPSKYYDTTSEEFVVNNTTTYLPAPTITGDILDVTNASNVSSNSYSVAIGARANTSTKASTYSGTFVITMVANPIPYSITYDQNTTDTVTDMPNPNPQTGSVDTETPTITLASAPARDGYGFGGWCTVQTTDGDGCGGTWYEAGDSYSIDYVNGGNVFTLYAMWWEMDMGYCVDLGAEYCMQNVADWESDLSVGDEVEAMDMRDGKIYYVARLADDNIWMTQNLDYDIVDGGGGINYENTDVPEDWGDFDNVPNMADTHSADDASWYYDPIQSESYDPGDVCWIGQVGQGITDDCSDMHYHLGNYYNWPAAVAVASLEPYVGAGVFDELDQSICPAGWRLPGSGNRNYDSGTFFYLAEQYNWAYLSNGNMIGGSSLLGNPVYFVMGNCYSGGGAGGGTDFGWMAKYWSNTSDTIEDAYYFEYYDNGSAFDSEIVFPWALDNDNNNGEGRSVRCIMRQ